MFGLAGLLIVCLAHVGVDFGYVGQKPLFKNVDFGIDMESRSKCLQKVNQPNHM